MDWREVFRRYVEVVGQCEGVAFLYRNEWSPEEWAAICEVLGLPENTEWH